MDFLWGLDFGLWCLDCSQVDWSRAVVVVAVAVAVAVVLGFVISSIAAVVFGRKGCVCFCLLYTSPSPRDGLLSRMPSSA